MTDAWKIDPGETD